MSDTIGPAYKRMADDLRSKISRDTLPVGEPIPSTSQLMKTYGVSQTVVRRAVADLIADKILIGHPGKAVYVKAKPADVDDEQASAAQLRSDLSKVQEEIRALSERLGHLHAHLMELYNRLGQPYPGNDMSAGQSSSSRSRRKTGS